MRANCLLVALWLWFRGRGHGWIAMRRSDGLRGLIPHFAYAARARGWMLTVEFSPGKSKSWIFSRGDSPLLFRGNFVIRTYVLVNRAEHGSPADALRAIRIFESSTGSKHAKH
jgi:hypothetical protein